MSPFFSGVVGRPISEESCPVTSASRTRQERKNAELCDAYRNWQSEAIKLIGRFVMFACEVASAV